MFHFYRCGNIGFGRKRFVWSGVQSGGTDGDGGADSGRGQVISY